MLARRHVALLLASLVLGSALPASGATARARHPRKAPHAAKTLTLEWVGDMAISTQEGLPPGGVPGATAPEAGFLHHADITLGNLEGTLSTSGPSKCGAANGGDCYAFQAPPSYAFGLRRAGFRLVNQANNHSMDFGASGRSQTVAALRDAGVAETGFPGQITILRAAGMRVAFLGFAPYPYDSNLLDIPAAQALVARAHHEASIVVVIIHAGAEGAAYAHVPYGEQYYLGEDRGNARAFAHAVIRAGASIVFGSGPHVIRGIERYRGHLIAYSLGNFIGYHTLGGGGVLSDSGILRVTLNSSGQVTAGRWFSITLSDGLPYPDPSNASARLVSQLSAEDFGSERYDILPNGFFHIPSRRRRHGRLSRRALQ